MVAPASIGAVSLSARAGEAIDTRATATAATTDTADFPGRRALAFRARTLVACSSTRFSLGRILLEELERPHGAPGGHVGEIGIAGPHHVRTGSPAGDGDVLLAVALPGDRLANDARGRLEFPEHLS